MAVQARVESHLLPARKKALPGFRVVRDYLGAQNATAGACRSPPSSKQKSAIWMADHDYEEGHSGLESPESTYSKLLQTPKNFLARGGRPFPLWQTSMFQAEMPRRHDTCMTLSSLEYACCTSSPATFSMENLGSDSGKGNTAELAPALCEQKTPLHSDISIGDVPETPKALRFPLSGQESEFCLSSVSCSIDKLIRDFLEKPSLQRFPESPRTQTQSLNACPLNQARGFLTKGPCTAKGKNLFHGEQPRKWHVTSFHNNEVWARSAAAVAFAAAALSPGTTVSAVARPKKASYSDRSDVLSEEDVEAFVEAKKRIEEVAARIRKEIVAARGNRGLPKTPGGREQPSTKKASLSLQTSAATLVATSEWARTSPNHKANLAHSRTCGTPATTSVPARRSSSGRSEGHLPHRKLTVQRRKAFGVAHDANFREELLAKGVRVQTDNHGCKRLLPTRGVSSVKALVEMTQPQEFQPPPASYSAHPHDALPGLNTTELIIGQPSFTSASLQRLHPELNHAPSPKETFSDSGKARQEPSVSAMAAASGADVSHPSTGTSHVPPVCSYSHDIETTKTSLPCVDSKEAEIKRTHSHSPRRPMVPDWEANVASAPEEEARRACGMTPSAINLAKSAFAVEDVSNSESTTASTLERFRASPVVFTEKNKQKRVQLTSVIASPSLAASAISSQAEGGDKNNASAHSAANTSVVFVSRARSMSSSITPAGYRHLARALGKALASAGERQAQRRAFSLFLRRDSTHCVSPTRIETLRGLYTSPTHKNACTRSTYGSVSPVSVIREECNHEKRTAVVVFRSPTSQRRERRPVCLNTQLFGSSSTECTVRGGSAQEKTNKRIAEDSNCDTSSQSERLPQGNEIPRGGSAQILQASNTHSWGLERSCVLRRQEGPDSAPAPRSTILERLSQANHCGAIVTRCVCASKERVATTLRKEANSALATSVQETCTREAIEARALTLPLKVCSQDRKAAPFAGQTLWNRGADTVEQLTFVRQDCALRKSPVQEATSVSQARCLTEFAHAQRPCSSAEQSPSRPFLWLHSPSSCISTFSSVLWPRPANAEEGGPSWELSQMHCKSGQQDRPQTRLIDREEAQRAEQNEQREHTEEGQYISSSPLTEATTAQIRFHRQISCGSRKKREHMQDKSDNGQSASINSPAAATVDSATLLSSLPFQGRPLNTLAFDLDVLGSAAPTKGEKRITKAPGTHNVTPTSAAYLMLQSRALHDESLDRAPAVGGLRQQQTSGPEGVRACFSNSGASPASEQPKRNPWNSPIEKPNQPAGPRHAVVCSGCPDLNCKLRPVPQRTPPSVFHTKHFVRYESEELQSTTAPQRPQNELQMLRQRLAAQRGEIASSLEKLNLIGGAGNTRIFSNPARAACPLQKPGQVPKLQKQGSLEPASDLPCNFFPSHNKGTGRRLDTEQKIIAGSQTHLLPIVRRPLKEETRQSTAMRKRDNRQRQGHTPLVWSGGTAGEGTSAALSDVLISLLSYLQFCKSQGSHLTRRPLVRRQGTHGQQLRDATSKGNTPLSPARKALLRPLLPQMRLPSKMCNHCSQSRRALKCVSALYVVGTRLRTLPHATARGADAYGVGGTHDSISTLEVRPAGVANAVAHLFQSPGGYTYTQARSIFEAVSVPGNGPRAHGNLHERIS